MSNGLLMLLVIVAAIAIGFVTHINTGVIAMSLAYLFGCFVLGMKPSAIQAFWPAKIFFILFSVSFLYNYASNNGSMDKLAKYLLYKIGKSARFLPWMIFAVGWVLAAAGAGAYSIVALLAPIGFAMAEKIGMSKSLVGMAIYFGAVGGGVAPTSSTGATAMSIISSVGYEATATSLQLTVMLLVGVVYIIDLAICYFVFKGHKVNTKVIAFEKPEPFDKKQKQSLMLILVFVIVLLVPFILSMIMPEVGFVKALVKYNDVAFTALLLCVVAVLLKLGDEKKAIASIPWPTIIMVCGISILVSVAVEAGTLDMVINAVTSIDNPSIITVVMNLGAGIMSIFSSTTGVVLPTLYPTVPAISEIAGIAPALLMPAICIGSVSTGMSPFSACGGILLGCAKEKDVPSMYKALLIAPFVGLIIGAVFVGALVMFF